MFEGDNGVPVKLASNFNRLVAEYYVFSSKVVVHHPTRILLFVSWTPPNLGWVKVNFDANVATGTNRGLGVVIRDEHGKMLVAGSEKCFPIGLWIYVKLLLHTLVLSS